MVDFSLDILAPQDDEDEATENQKNYILKDLEATLSGDSSKFDELKFTGLDEDRLTKSRTRYLKWAIPVLIITVIVLFLMINR